MYVCMYVYIYIYIILFCTHLAMCYNLAIIQVE